MLEATTLIEGMLFKPVFAMVVRAAAEKVDDVAGGGGRGEAWERGGARRP
jgi:hypothetical protein